MKSILKKNNTTKIPFVDYKLLNDVIIAKQNYNKTKKQKIQITTSSRATIILPIFVDLVINVHNGKNFIPVTILPTMCGYRLGEFVSTRKRQTIQKNKKKRKK
jgi:ribosomal protein S19